MAICKGDGGREEGREVSPKPGATLFTGSQAVIRRKDEAAAQFYSFFCSDQTVVSGKKR